MGRWPRSCRAARKPSPDGWGTCILPAAYSPPIYRRLVNYFAARGRFGKAEDVLFRWLDSGDGEARAAGEEFYGQLFKLDDAILARGNLPRPEAEAGLRELRSTRTA